MGIPRSVITTIWASIQNRHRVAGLIPPIQGFGEFFAWTRCLACLVGRPTALLFPVHRNNSILVARMLLTSPALILDERDLLTIALAIICCLRVSELIAQDLRALV